MNRNRRETDFHYPHLQPNDVPGMITPSLITSISDKTYTVSYNLIGGQVFEEMVIRHYIEGPPSLDTSGGLFTTKMYVRSQRTWSYDFSGLNSNSSNFQIGRFNETRIDAWTEPGDVFRQMPWDGSYMLAGGISTEFKIGYSFKAPNLPIYSYDINYQFTKSVPSDDFLNFDNSGADKTRTAGTKFKAGMYLKNTDNTFDVNFLVGHYNTAAQKKLYVTWTYEVSNGQDPYGSANGIKTSSMYSSYWSA